LYGYPESRLTVVELVTKWEPLPDNLVKVIPGVIIVIKLEDVNELTWLPS
jgi:hypothetical protein